mgnify:CR=1 FL=1
MLGLLLKEHPGINGDVAVMVGDREQDINGAIANGIDSLGVLYGYGSLDELKEAGATYIAENPSDTEQLVI